MTKKRVYRSGVRFDCPGCGRLWKDDLKHSPPLRKACPACVGDLKLVAKGEVHVLVGDAIWLRCLACKGLFMKRRGEIVATTPRAGFSQFTQL